MRIAYLITSYRSASQLARLLGTLRAAQPDAELIVHHDTFQVPLDPAVVEAVGGHLFTSDRPVVWGDISLDLVRWRLMRWALDNVAFDWMVTLSEQDYPIAPSAALESYLAGCGADAVVDAERVDGIAEPVLREECRRRYDHQYLSLPAVRAPAWTPRLLLRAAGRLRRMLFAAVNAAPGRAMVYIAPPELRLPSRVGVRARRSPFGDAYPCWYASAWFAMSRNAVRRVVDVADERPDLVRYFSRTVIPVESAMQTILCNDPQLRVLLEPLHHVRWADTEVSRPDVFGVDDFDELVSSGRFFARKVDAEHGAQLLDRLDAHVLARPVTRQPAQTS